MSRDKLIKILVDTAGASAGKVADAIIAAGPVVSDETMAQLRDVRAQYMDACVKGRPADFARLSAFDGALVMLGLLNIVRDQS